MASSFAISRSLLVYAVCIPLAIILGYFLSDPLSAGNVLLVLVVVMTLSIPLLMRWHHLFLVCAWNASISLFFLPGNPQLWLFMTFISIFFSLVNRSLGQNQGFFIEPAVSRSLMFVAFVVLVTVYMTGGIGVRSLGSETYGGRKYFYLLGAVLGYFALSCQRIQPRYAGWFVALFFLSGVTGVLGYLAAFLGGPFEYVIQLFPIDDMVVQLLFGADSLNAGLMRLSCFTFAAIGVWCFLLSRYGVRGLFQFTRPWRMGALLLALVACLSGGFRSLLILFILTFLCNFYWEGLFRTRLFGGLILACVLLGAVGLPFAERLPLSMQRTLSFVPLIPLDPMARMSAEASTDWRLEMWRDVLPEVPKYLIKGKGYSLGASEMGDTLNAVNSGSVSGSELASVAGDFHNGPLSVIIPFGLFGVGALIWFFAAAIRMLYRNYQFGSPELKPVNTFILAYFVAKILFFVFIFGGLNSDLLGFTGLAGLSVSLNGNSRRPAELPAEAAS